MPLSAAHRLLAELTKSGCVRQLRHQGDYGLTITEVFAPGMAAVAAPVVASGTTLGVVTIAGPAVRPDEARMKALGGSLVGTAREVAGPSKASSLFKRYVAATTARAGQASSR